MDWIHHDGTRLGVNFLDQGLPPQAFTAGHGDRAQGGVSPVDVAVHPVHCEAIWVFDTTVDHSGVVRVVVCFVYWSAGDITKKRRIPIEMKKGERGSHTSWAAGFLAGLVFSK